MSKTPTKAKTPTRTSPRKKAWASPVKNASKLVSSIFKEEDFSPLNKSWAEVTEEDTALTSRLVDSCKSERSRKTTTPKRATSKNNFEKSLKLTDAIYGSGRKSERKTRETKIDNYFPSASKQQSRKRQLSSSTVDESEGASPSKRPMRGASSTGRPVRKVAKEETTKANPARVRLFTDSKSSERPSVNNAPEDVKWCKDEKTLARRTKEIDRAKEKPIYKKYLDMVPKQTRLDSRIHPKTPNKLLNYSRRSWDSQIRIWKRRLYVVCGEEPSESVAGSETECDSLNTSMHSVDEDMDYDGHNLENEPVLGKLTEIVIRPEADAMASLLGRFDMDTRSGGESTLKAPTTAADSTGPVDFSGLHH